MGLGGVLSNFDGTNAFGATRRELLSSTLQQTMAKENDRLFAADSLQHGSMHTASARRPCHPYAKQRGADTGAEGCYNPSRPVAAEPSHRGTAPTPGWMRSTL